MYNEHGQRSIKTEEMRWNLHRITKTDKVFTSLSLIEQYSEKFKTSVKTAPP